MTTIAATHSAPRLNRANTEPLPGTGGRPELRRSHTAPAAASPAQAGVANPAASSQGKPPASNGTAKVSDSFTPASSAPKGWHAGAVNQATAGAQASGTGPVGGLRAGAGLAGGVGGIGANSKGLVEAIQNNEGGQAIAQHALGLTRGILGATKGALDTAAFIESARGFNKVGQAAKDAIGSQGRLSGAIANAAAEAVHNGKPLRDVDVLASIAKGQGVWSNIKHSTQMALADQLRAGGFEKAAGKIESSVAKAGQKAADAAKGAKVADAAIDAAKGAEAALKTGAKGAGTAARLAGRFAPGLNIAMAGVDTAIAARTLSDPKASIASKVTSSITAAGSIAAATNIPIVSQVGAAVSAVSSVTGLAIENAGKIKEGFKKLGDKIKSLF